MSKFKTILKRMLLNILMFPVLPVFAAESAVNLANANSSELINTYYDKVALKAETPFMVLEQFAVKSKDIPQNSGETVKWYKVIPLAVDTTLAALTEESTAPAATELQFQASYATVQSYGKVVSVSEFLGLIAIEPDLESKSKSLGIHRGKFVDLLYWQALVENLYPMRIDADSTYEVAGAEDGTATETTIVVGDAAVNVSAGGVLVVTSGNNKGMGGYVASYSTPAITLSTTKPSYAMNEACTVADTYKFANSTGLTAADPLTCAGAAKGVVILMVNHAVPLADGYYIGVLSPFTQYDIRNDSAWVNANQYAGSKRLFNNEVGEWGGIRWVMDTLPWRSTAATMGTYAAAGAVFHTPIFGDECYAGVKLQGSQDSLIFKTKQEIGGPLELYSTAGWKARLACKVLNATWGVQILSGCTSIS